MMVLRRITLPLINSFVITAALFGLMYSLIFMDEPELQNSTVLPRIILSDIPEEIPPKPLFEKIEAPKEVALRPELLVDEEKFEMQDIDTLTWNSYEAPVLDRGKGVPVDNQLVIAIGFPPEYPSGALRRGIEGWVVVGFSVSAVGAVFEPYILESEPQGVFDRASLKAISRFKYKARQVNGRPASTSGQRYMFTFKIEE